MTMDQKQGQVKYPNNGGASKKSTRVSRAQGSRSYQNGIGHAENEKCWKYRRLTQGKKGQNSRQPENSLLYKWEVMSNTKDHLHSCCNKFVEWDTTYTCNSWDQELHEILQRSGGGTMAARLGNFL